MGYTVIGRLVDKDKNPIEFAQVYTSDANGKPIVGSKHSQTDEKGRWRLTDVNDNNYITGTFVGFNKKTIPAKSIIPIPNVITGIPERIIQITLNEDKALSELKEVVVKSTKVTKKPSNIGKYVVISSIGLLIIAGTLLILKNKKLI